MITIHDRKKVSKKKAKQQAQKMMAMANIQSANGYDFPSGEYIILRLKGLGYALIEIPSNRMTGGENLATMQPGKFYLHGSASECASDITIQVNQKSVDRNSFLVDNLSSKKKLKK